MSCHRHTKRVKSGVNDARTWWGRAQFIIPQFSQHFSVINAAYYWILPPTQGGTCPGGPHFDPPLP